MLTIENLSRRTLLKGMAAGSGAFVLGGTLLAAGRALAVPNLPTAFAPNLFVSIDVDVQVTITPHRTDMSPGNRTGLAQSLAVAIEAHWPDASGEGTGED